MRTFALNIPSPLLTNPMNGINTAELLPTVGALEEKIARLIALNRSIRGRNEFLEAEYDDLNKELRLLRTTFAMREQELLEEIDTLRRSAEQHTDALRQKQHDLTQYVRIVAQLVESIHQQPLQ